MKYTTTTSRRVILVKVKAKPVSRVWPPPVNRKDTIIDHAVRASVPLLFNRSSSPWAPVSPPTPWWENWKTIALIIMLGAALFVGIYLFLAKDSRTDESRSVKVEKPVVKAPAVINMRPMGLPSSRRSTSTEVDQMSAGSSGGNYGHLSGSGADREISVNRGRSVSNSAPTGAVANYGPLDERSKLVLPHDVSGACTIGESGLQDFTGCLARNGARPE